jgi:hypothetical protein
MKQKVLTTTVVALFLAVAMIGIRHIDRLNDGIQLKKIELKDNSAKLQILDQKYNDLNNELNKKDSDKSKVEEQLKQLQEERDRLSRELQAKLQQKQRDVAVKAQNAVSTPKASASGGCADWMAQAGIPQTQATTKLILKESGCNPRAINPTSGACGIPQAWPCSKLPNGVNTDPVTQLRWMDNYVKVRYGSWENALATWYSRCGSAQGCWY